MWKRKGLLDSGDTYMSVDNGFEIAPLNPGYFLLVLNSFDKLSTLIIYTSTSHHRSLIYEHLFFYSKASFNFSKSNPFCLSSPPLFQRRNTVSLLPSAALA